ncbi:TetR/AcrR family transcriptional regulator C-terminal domain-containing protein [Actinoplanes sp. NEAU-A12]|uniref:TetR/AcrR family transcriptional regulator C-terminal domain-containing protein n=1 Tax=Actinoplanes sandaracinus TaxID=3045177 RepID=A0ABT6WKP2_9ACTN|nr:TetR/AcrR family transcriptional regulator C-terminal domain-containing protein [Actinoplanes sandaracinus]MDI6100296.1 TetR/AcrR family transcriptional regulator C-terminal domain-containing protein [Actinoplanes sandaracinus]
MSGPTRRGRPRAGEQVARRHAALDAALAELVAHGPERTTMQSVAVRAGCSKESLYAWFANRDGLLAALVERQSEQVNTAVSAALTGAAPPRETLTAIAENLLRLLTSETSLALNRAAMTSTDLAALLLRHGRHTTGPLIEAFLSRLADQGELRVDDPADAFQLFYGLVVRDVQIRALLGEAPAAGDARAAARVAVDRFLTLLAHRPADSG